MKSKADCDANPSLNCVCYDTCPTGATYYPQFELFSLSDPSSLNFSLDKSNTTAHTISSETD